MLSCLKSFPLKMREGHVTIRKNWGRKQNVRECVSRVRSSGGNVARMVSTRMGVYFLHSWPIIWLNYSHELLFACSFQVSVSRVIVHSSINFVTSPFDASFLWHFTQQQFVSYVILAVSCLDLRQDCHLKNVGPLLFPLYKLLIDMLTMPLVSTFIIG